MSDTEDQTVHWLSVHRQKTSMGDLVMEVEEIVLVEVCVITLLGFVVVSWGTIDSNASIKLQLFDEITRCFRSKQPVNKYLC